MTGLLCVGRPPEWWWTGNPGNSLAVAICRRCEGCPDNDPAPHGVIRHGNAYADSGIVLPTCPNCDRPNSAYRGGEAGLCKSCAVPDVSIPSCRGDRNQQIAQLVGRGLNDTAIGFDLGLRPESVRRRRQNMGLLLKRGPQPTPEHVTV